MICLHAAPTPFLAPPTTDILKFFGCELGAQTNYDKGTGTSIVNGAHDTKKLCELLEAFIKKYVQCYDCGNPETVVKIKKECIYLKCKACGFVSGVDMRHKVNTFMLRNPPECKMTKEEKKWVAGVGAGRGGVGGQQGKHLPNHACQLLVSCHIMPYHSPCGESTGAHHLLFWVRWLLRPRYVGVASALPNTRAVSASTVFHNPHLLSAACLPHRLKKAEEERVRAAAEAEEKEQREKKKEKKEKKK
jgi:hypothetical protein